MAVLRLFGINLPSQKRVPIALRYIYGVGPTRADEICSNLKINPLRRLKDLSESEIRLIVNFIEKHYIIESDLKKQIRTNIQHLKLIKSYRGLRHTLQLPVRGQRTHTNAKTQKKFKR